MVKRSVYRVKVKERFQKLGLWRDFVERRDRYVTLGMTPAQAFGAAVEEVEGKYPNGKVEQTAQMIPIMQEIEADDIIARLIRISKGRKASPLQEFTWVYTHSGVAWEDITPAEVPSPGAVYHLSRVKSSDAAYAKFLTDYAKLLPPRSQLESESRTADDGRKVFALINALEQELARGEANEAVSPAVGVSAGSAS